MSPPPRWGFMQKFEVPDYDRPRVNYLTRYRLVQTPWFGIYLHRMDGPDPRPTLHDHPWNFTTVRLLGGYVEKRLDPHTMRSRLNWFCKAGPRIQRVRAFEAHYIKNLLRVPTWTLVFVGKRRRTWGYWEQDAPGWSRTRWLWTEFDQHPYNEEFQKALAQRAEIHGEDVV